MFAHGIVGTAASVLKVKLPTEDKYSDISVSWILSVLQTRKGPRLILSTSQSNVHNNDIICYYVTHAVKRLFLNI
jgi:hypothetical protein